MTYIRVIPRDLFNESSLLKCYGRLYICLENVAGHSAELREEFALGEEFRVLQSSDDGSISLANVGLYVRGERVPLSRPLNSRDPWPLWAVTGEDEIEVFAGDGNLSPEFLAFICSHDWEPGPMRSGGCVVYECTRCGAEEERDRS